jgi:hypothetical protein
MCVRSVVVDVGAHGAPTLICGRLLGGHIRLQVGTIVVQLLHANLAENESGT